MDLIKRAGSEEIGAGCMLVFLLRSMRLCYEMCVAHCAGREENIFMEQTRDLTAGKPAGLILRMAVPLMLGSVCQQLYTMVDTAIVGQVLGVDALASLGAADWLNWLVLGVMVGFADGFSILVAHRFGARDERELRKTVAMIVFLAAGIAVLLTLCSQSVLYPVLLLLNTPSGIIGGSQEYLRVIFSGIVVVMTYNVMAALLRALGNSRTPLFAMLTASVINIGLDLLFVLVFGWGIAGAAVATVIAQVGSCLFCLRALLKIKMLRPRKEDWKLDGAVIKGLLRMGIPTAFQNTIIAVGGMAVQYVVNGLGVVFVAGFTATNKLYGLLELAATSFGSAVAAFTGQKLGAGKIPRIRQGIRSAALMAFVTSLGITAVMLLFGRWILSLFVSGTPEEIKNVLDVAYRYLSVMAVFLSILYMLHVHRSGLMGLGDTVTPMLSGIMEMLMRVGTVWILPRFVGNEGVFFAEVIAWAGAALLLVLVFYGRLHKLWEVWKFRQETAETVETAETPEIPEAPKPAEE